MIGAPDRPAPSGWAVAAAVLAVLFLVYLLRLVLLPVGFAAALAYVLRPFAKLLHHRLRLPWLVTVLLVYGLVLAIVALLLWWLIASIMGASASIAEDLPHRLTQQAQRLMGPEIDLLGKTISTDALVRRAMDGAETWLAQPTPLLVSGGIIVAGPAAAVLMLVVLFYFLLSGRRLAEGVLWLAPPQHRPRFRGYYRRIHPMLYQYIRGVFLVVLYTTVVAWLVLGPIFRLPYAVPLSIVVGLLELIPVVGPTASMMLVGVAALLNGGGLWQFLGLMGFAVALRLSIDQGVGPLLLGRAVTLHPVVIIMSFLVASTLYGVLGVLFAVPVAAAGKIVLSVIYDENGSTGGH